MKRVLSITVFVVFASSIFAIFPIDNEDESINGDVIEYREVEILHDVTKKDQSMGLPSIKNDIKNQNNLKF